MLPQPQPPVLSAPALPWPRTRAHWDFCLLTPCHCPSTDLSLSDLLWVLRLCVSLALFVLQFLLSAFCSLLCPSLWDPGPAPVHPPPISKMRRWSPRARPLNLWKNLPTYPQPLATLLVPLLQRMKFGCQGKLRPEVGAGVWLSPEEHSFCGWSSILGPLPCQRLGRGRGPGFPLP